MVVLFETVTVADAVAVQPPERVTVTVYVVLTEGLTVMLCVVAVLLHAYAVPAPAVNVALPEGQTVADGGVMLTVGLAATTMLPVPVPVHPVGEVAVTV